MYDPQKKWPLQLTVQQQILFVGLTIIAFVLLGTIDAPLTADVAKLPSMIRDPFHIVTRPGNSDWIFIPSIVLVLVCWPIAALLAKSNLWGQRARLVAKVSGFVIAGVGFPGIVCILLKRIIGRARPINFEQLGTLHFEPFRDWSFQSFPSGDTTTVFAFAAVVAFFVPRLKVWLLIGAGLVGLARIMLAMHYPTDVLAGILLGTFGAFAARNFYLSRNWLFTIDKDGRIVPGISWPRASERSGKSK